MIEEKDSYVYLGRQPILDKNKKVIAYELLYRTSYIDFAFIKNSRSATSRVIVNIFNNIGVENIAGNKKVFINISNEVIQSEILKLIEPKNIVLEILEDTIIDDKTLEKLKELKEYGYEIAIDDFLPYHQTRKILHFTDFVKIDVLNTSPDMVKKIVKNIKERYPGIKVLAEKVESYSQFKDALETGFELFQGYFFARPTILTHKKFDPMETTLIRILKELNKKDVDLKKIENIMKKDVKICFNLLKFVNSAYFSFKQEIKTITHAVSLLGVNNLKMWILLMLYADAKSRDVDNPLLDLALIRGKMMEILSSKIYNSKYLPEMAYLTGLLSLLDALLGINKEDILKDLNLDKRIKEALLEEKNTLGLLLKIAEAIEISDYENLKTLAEEVGLSLKDILDAEVEGIKYAERIKEIYLKKLR